LALKSFNNRLSFEQGLWQRQLGWFAGMPKTSVFDRMIMAGILYLGINIALTGYTCYIYKT
jgi:hypothetical protein